MMEKNSRPRWIKSPEGRARIVIEKVDPEIDGGLYPIKRAPQEKVRVKVDLLSDGHDEING